MLSRFGIEASQAAQYVIAFAIILVLVALFGLVLRRLTGGRLMLPGQERGRARQPRLGIVDIYDLDRQRQLILLRRDNVEHLLLVGGPNDVVIETNIVRVAGARVQAPAVEPALERHEPTLERPPEAPRPQVDVSGRPSLEAQLAARLGTVASRASSTSDADEELAPVASATATTPARVEPMLKPDAVTVTAAPPQRMARPEPAARPAPPVEPPVRAEPPRPVTPQPTRPEPPRPAASQPAPSPFPAAPVTTPEPSRPVPTPPAPPSPPAPAAPQAAAAPPAQPAAARAAEPRVPDAVILSDMAKQLEEALKRPVSPVASAPDVAPVEEPEPEDEDELLAPPPRPVQSAPPPPPPVQPSPRVSEPPRAAMEPAPPPQAVVPPPPQPVAAPPPVPPAPPAPPSPARAAPPVQQAQPELEQEQESPQPRKVHDPFSVEEIEAEFARLLGRPLEKSDRT